jgi:predicted RNA binding protein YcfA (HicA-like mRNA interferase family)
MNKASAMKWSELRKKAEKNGWFLHRHGSKHDIYLHPDKDYPIQIERHDSQEVKRGLYNKLKNQIGF